MANIKNEKANTFTKREFISIVKSFKSMRSAAKALDIPFGTFKRYATKYVCYNPNQSGKGIPGEEKKSLKKVLNNRISIKTWSLKQKLWRYGLKLKKCEDCGLREKWNNKELSLELHHIDGNKINNNISNLQILCPNCHSQTDNYRNRKSGR